MRGFCFFYRFPSLLDATIVVLTTNHLLNNQITSVLHLMTDLGLNSQRRLGRNSSFRSEVKELKALDKLEIL